MTKEREEFLERYSDKGSPFYAEMERRINALIAAEIAASQRPKPPFVKPFSVERCMTGGYYIRDAEGTCVLFKSDNGKIEADFICEALNKYEPE